MSTLLLAYGTGVGGSMCSSASPTGGRIANVSIAGPRSRSGFSSAAAVGLAAEERGLDDDERLAAQELRQVRDRRELEHAADRRDLVRHAREPLVPRVQHLARALVREEQNAGVDLADRVQVELERGHDAEVAAAAAQRPEELGLVRGIDAAQLAVGGDELDRRDAVRGEAVLAAVPAEAAAERVADDADVRGGAVQRGDAEVGRARHDLLPLGAGAHAGGEALGVELDALELVGPQQDGVAEIAERRRVVAGALRGDLEAGLGRVAHDGGDVVGVQRRRDHGGALVDGGVEGLAREVPTLLAGADHGDAAKVPAQRPEADVWLVDRAHESLLELASDMVGTNASRAARSPSQPSNSTFTPSSPVARPERASPSNRSSSVTVKVASSIATRIGDGAFRRIEGAP